MKKIIQVVLVVALLLTTPLTTLANAPVYSEKPTGGIESLSSDIGKGYSTADTAPYDPNQVVSASSSYGTFQYGSCSIEKVSSGYIKGFGDTVATQVSGTVGYTLYFQMWDGYNWVDVGSATNTKYNVSEAYDFHFKTVIKGKNYRVRVEHFVTDGGNTTTGTSYSSYIYVD